MDHGSLVKATLGQRQKALLNPDTVASGSNRTDSRSPDRRQWTTVVKLIFLSANALATKASRGGPQWSRPAARTRWPGWTRSIDPMVDGEKRQQDQRRLQTDGFKFIRDYVHHDDSRSVLRRAALPTKGKGPLTDTVARPAKSIFTMESDANYTKTYSL